MQEERPGPRNFSWVRDDLAGMALPYEDVWEALLERGIGAVLTLSVARPPGEPARAGLAWRHHPIEDFGVPEPRDLDRTWRWVREQLAADRKVVVHCRAGLGRTGMVLAAFLAADGMDPDDAIAHVRRLRPGSIETPDQERFVHAFGARHAGRKE